MCMCGWNGLYPWLGQQKVAMGSTHAQLSTPGTASGLRDLLARCLLLNLYLLGGSSPVALVGGTGCTGWCTWGGETPLLAKSVKILVLSCYLLWNLMQNALKQITLKYLYSVKCYSLKIPRKTVLCNKKWISQSKNVWRWDYNLKVIWDHIFHYIWGIFQTWKYKEAGGIWSMYILYFPFRVQIL